MIRVFSLDEAKLTIEGLLTSFAGSDDIQFVGSSNDSGTAIPQIEQCNPDIVLMESQFSNIQGPILARKISNRWGHIKVIAYSSSEEEQIVLGMARAGVHGYILKRDDVNLLAKGIRQVAQGKKWFSPELVAVLLKQASKKTLSEYGLSVREKGVFQLLIDGLTNQEIASKLIISKGTVRNHVSSIYRKLEFSNRLEAIRWAIGHDFLEN